MRIIAQCPSDCSDGQSRVVRTQAVSLSSFLYISLRYGDYHSLILTNFTLFTRKKRRFNCYHLFLSQIALTKSIRSCFLFLEMGSFLRITS